MRIALFTETYLPVINGVVTHVKTLKEGLERLGHRVLIVTADSNVKKHEIDSGVMYCPAVKIRRIYNYDAASPISPKRVKFLRAFKPDLIHIHNEFGIGMSGMLIAKILKIPLVYTLHTMYDDYIYYVANRYFCKFITAATHKYAKVLANQAGALIGPSKKVGEFFKKCGVKKSVNVIPNTAETDIFNPALIEASARKALRERFGFTDSDFVFCFCGRLGKEKNISWLIESWAKRVKREDGLKLLIIGDGPYYEQHTDEIKSLNACDTITLAGKVEHADLPPYYAACDAYVTASLTENHSISMLEAMCMKLPVLHIKDELNAGQVVDGVSGYGFSNGDEMYALLQKLRDLPKDKLAEFGESTRSSVINSGSANMARDILKIYEFVIINYARQRRARALRKLRLKPRTKRKKT
ncbi:MAG: glycosyltransferase [Oscillospiraceae bacterium]|nr:glycosyltransferase [Oscillospiraceae bacterium]